MKTMLSIPIFSEVVGHLAKTYAIPNFHDLCHQLPVFPVYSSQVKVLQEPNEFYKELLSQCDRAHKRISLASLYIGTGQLETNLISAISSSLLSKPDLKVNLLLDYTRASRNVCNSRTVLLPLIQHFPSACHVSLYHTPALRGLLKLLIPERWNETVGLQHMKIYIFDSSVIVSGANLSQDYFQNRQDRYVVINDCEPLANFYENLIKIISTYSLQLNASNMVEMKKDIIVHPFKGSYNEYCNHVRKAFQNFWDLEIISSKSRLKELVTDNENTGNKIANTLIFPTVQMSHFGITLDSDITEKFLMSAAIQSRIHLASGYFNLTDQYIESILKRSNAYYNIVCAHPQANGFLGASGFAGGIPAAYTHLCKMFYEKILHLGLTERIHISEFKRSGWTFHAKGVWYFLPKETLPVATMIGSPNFGYRSVYKDLETQLLIATCCPILKTAIYEEQQRLYDSSLPVSDCTFKSPTRIIPFWVKLFTFFLKNYF